MSLLIQTCELAKIHTLIDGFFKMGNQEAAFDLYEEMRNEGLELNNIVVDVLVNGLRKNGKFEETESLFKEMREKGIMLDRVNYASMMDMLFKKGNFSAAFEIEHEMTDKNVGHNIVVFNILINCLSALGKFEEAKKLTVNLFYGDDHLASWRITSDKLIDKRDVTVLIMKYNGGNIRLHTSEEPSHHSSFCQVEKVSFLLSGAQENYDPIVE
ncbi:pentatricopeptide repeat-containing protein At5g14770, mitochondrial-like [Asparagus officinalis]|uniref:pentatricopeptide repeat-containing protein At5g14770, mitochondrial-like n=1 Tax=Asparagus officinalis TaxID=4686 RepID=UPI00098E31B2|nr:pentatricopeptide repeat-containing protein At5g14770, mitochondrial-like [Asparagus officinalis]